MSEDLQRGGRLHCCWFMGINRAYVLSRAAEEDERAASADSEAAKDAHRQLAEFYRRSAEEPGPRRVADAPTKETTPTIRC